MHQFGQIGHGVQGCALLLPSALPSEGSDSWHAPCVAAYETAWSATCARGSVALLGRRLVSSVQWRRLALGLASTAGIWACWLLIRRMPAAGQPGPVARWRRQGAKTGPGGRSRLAAGLRSGLAVLDSCRGIFDQGLMKPWFVLVGGVPVSSRRCRARRPAASWLRFALVDALRVCGPVLRVCGRSRRSPRR
jgi:hypothetical protein